MIEVKLTLEHEGEVHLFQQFVGFLRQARIDWAARGGIDSPVPPGGVLVEEPAPAVSDAPKAEGITDADLEGALMAFAKKNGTPAAVELLASFGIKRLPDLPGQERSRFYARCFA